MANCKKCDRCGTTYEHYGYATEDNSKNLYTGMANSMCFCFETLVSSNVYEKQKKIDLCPECFGNLVSFMNGADIVSAIRTMEDKNNG